MCRTLKSVQRNNQSKQQPYHIILLLMQSANSN
uniref:Uncharacterized protein n=1 Tax=Arundo donax TaxID=35708 RepID=A0A0A8YLG3_ARUDO